MKIDFRGIIIANVFGVSKESLFRGGKRGGMKIGFRGMTIADMFGV